MPITPAVARVRFAKFVQGALARARERGMNDITIQEATGVASSTFHRWQRGEWNQFPRPEKVVAFCVGLGEQPDKALVALGIRDDGRAQEPEPELDPDIRRVARLLRDPAVAESDKAYIRRTLQMLGNLVPRRGERAKA